MSCKSGSLHLLEPSGPHRDCYGTAVPLLVDRACGQRHGPAALTPGNRPDTHYTGCVGPMTSLNGCEKSGAPPLTGQDPWPSRPQQVATPTEPSRPTPSNSVLSATNRNRSRRHNEPTHSRSNLWHTHRDVRPNLVKLEFSRKIFKKYSDKISRKSIQSEQSCSTRTDGREDTTKLTVAYRNFANAPTNECTNFHIAKALTA